MKKIFYFVFALALSTAFIGCNKTETPEETCNNNQLDGGETEIDCGGDCEPCPFSATLNCTFDGYTYVGTSINGSQQGNAISISSQGTAGTTVLFSFSGVAENTSLPITGARLDTNDDFYEFELSDTGHVVITSHDQLRKIISGTFSFSLHDYYNSNQQINVQNGTFENVRY